MGQVLDHLKKPRNNNESLGNKQHNKADNMSINVTYE